MLNFDSVWEKWHEYTYPWRPWKKATDKIASYCSENHSILILGSTQEYRVLCIGKKITLCDISSNMISSNSVWNKDEKILQKDWFHLQWGEYDLILWDLVFQLFPSEKQLYLLDRVINNLSKKWKCIFRIVSQVSREKQEWFLKLQSVMRKIKDRKILFNYITFELVNGLGYSPKEISQFLLWFSPEMNRYFLQEFFDLVPYSSGKSYVFWNDNPYEIFSHYTVQEIYTKEGVFVRESIIEVSR